MNDERPCGVCGPERSEQPTAVPISARYGRPHLDIIKAALQATCLLEVQLTHLGAVHAGSE